MEAGARNWLINHSRRLGVGEGRGKRHRANGLRKDSKAVNPQSPLCSQQYSSSQVFHTLCRQHHQ